ncbi:MULTISPECIES: hypothetical protein [unclassified Streptomyces]|nr:MULTISPECIES: hypothetical protein [unclassified Streptomyces]
MTDQGCPCSTDRGPVVDISVADRDRRLPEADAPGARSAVTG